MRYGIADIKGDLSVVDDRIVVRHGLASLFRAEPDIEIIGEASDGGSAIDLIRELRPDVVLMDISLSGMDGIQATRIIHNEYPEIRILGLSMFEDAQRARAMRGSRCGGLSDQERAGRCTN